MPRNLYEIQIRNAGSLALSSYWRDEDRPGLYRSGLKYVKMDEWVDGSVDT
jgi:hypothetical protein